MPGKQERKPIVRKCDELHCAGSFQPRAYKQKKDAMV